MEYAALIDQIIASFVLHAPSSPGFIVSKACIVRGFAIKSRVYDVC